MHGVRAGQEERVTSLHFRHATSANKKAKSPCIDLMLKMSLARFSYLAVAFGSHMAGDRREGPGLRRIPRLGTWPHWLASFGSPE